MAHKKSLFGLKKIWLSIITPLLVSAIWAAYIAGLWSDIPNNFWELVFEKLMNPDVALKGYKSPLAVAALVFPLVALVASHHRSVQMAAQIDRADSQIRLTDAKNNFENYVKHKELFDNRLDALAKELKINFNKKDELYSNIFSENSSLNFIPYVDEKSDGFLSLLEKKLDFEKKHHVNDYFALIDNIINIDEKLNFKYEFNFYNNENIFFPRNSKKHLTNIFTILDSLIEFSYVKKPNWENEIHIKRFGELYKNIERLYYECCNNKTDEVLDNQGSDLFNDDFTLDEREKDKLFLTFLQEQYNKELLNLTNIHKILVTAETEEQAL